MADIWQTLTEACQTLGISQRTLYRHVDKGKIESKLEDNRRLVLVTLPDDKPLADMADSMAGIDIAALQAKNDDLEQRLQDKDNEIAELKADIRGQMAAIQDRDSRITELQADNQYLREELRQKDQAVAVAQNTAQELIYQLKTPFWKRWFRRQKALPQGDVVDMETDEGKGVGGDG